MADRSIGELAEAPIGSLPAIADLYDDSLLAVEQQGEARKMTGAQWKRYAQAGVSAYVESARTAAETAREAASQVGGAAQAAEDSKEAAQTAQEGAEKARKAIEDLEVDSITLAAGEPASVEKTAAEDHVKLLFGIPTGKQGPRGLKGSSIAQIERTAGNGAAGTADTYTITLTDGSTHDFQVYNGADGKGAGDMTASVYDPAGKKADVFAYADGLLPVIHSLELSPDGWEGGEAPYRQTEAVPGALADETAQIIHIQPSDRAAWAANGLECTAQDADSLTFSAKEKPAEAVRLLVSVQAAKGGTSM